MRPTSADVSVVVQGPVGTWLSEVLASVRTHLPGAELVLSSWPGVAAGGHDADVVVESADPGSAPYRTYGGAPSPRLMNTNRLLRSSRAGVERASRPFTLKLRSDTPLLGPDVLDWWGRFPRRGADLRVFDERVLCPSVATRPSARTPDYLFHPSDCVHFGRTEDVLRFWSADEVDEHANTAYWLAPGREVPDASRGECPPRYYNEQLLWLAALAAAGHAVDYPYAGYRSHDAVEVSDASLVDNFVVLEPWQLGVAIPKLARMVRTSDLATYLSFDDWRALEARRAA